MYLKVVIFLVIFELSTVNSWGDSDRIRLRDVSALTLRQNQQTNGRRSSPIPQLQCVGGSAGCNAFTPQVVQCRNVGFDGYDVQWECKTDMDDSYRFGRVQVSCEGYDYPNDEYILKGSCGLEYTIDYTEAGRAKKSSWGSNYGKTYSASTWGNSGSDGGSWFIFFLIVFAVVFLVCKMSSSGSDDQSQRRPTAPYPDDQSPRYRRRDDPPPYGFKPEYGSTAGYNQPPTYEQTTRRCGSHTTQSSPVGGFWSGLGMGSLAGYLFGSRRNNYGYHHRPYNGGWGSGGYGWGSGYSHGGGWGSSWGSSSSYSSGRSSSGTTRTASGFGGTSRR